jgi:hypothetical protein
LPRILTRLTIQLALLITLLLALAAPAEAEPVEVTAQAKAARAEFLLRVAPPATPAAICLVDTGVNLTPDTAGVIARISLPGLDGSDQSPSRHGTRTAMFIGAQSNGFGMVGLWPHARIVSVQSNFPGQEVIPMGAYLTGINRCTVQAGLHGIKVIVVALSTETVPSPASIEDLTDGVLTARLQGLNVIVAAGDNAGRPVGTPANIPGAVSVGAVDAGTGAACPSSAAGARLLVLGCAVDAADPSTGQPLQGPLGTSAAAAIAGTALAALRTWRPDLGPDAAEQLLIGGGRLDLTAAFVAAGLQAVVEPPAPPPVPTVTPAPAPKQRLAKPRLSVRETRKGNRRTLTIRSRNRVAGTTLTVRVYRRTGRTLRRVATRTARSSRVVVRISRPWTKLTAQFTDPTGARLPSRSVAVPSRR